MGAGFLPLHLGHADELGPAHAGEAHVREQDAGDHRPHSCGRESASHVWTRNHLLRHFPDEVQGDIILGNAIGFLGIKQHQIEDDGTGWKTTFRHDLLTSTDRNFRPVDLEFAPDGSLYVIDWHNILIGHMQHNARDPMRDKNHGRIYRITYPGRPLVTPAQIAGAPLATLLENLKEPESRTRYRTRREIRNHPVSEVLPAVKKWASAQTDIHAKLEALWVTWGMNAVDELLLRELLASSDFRARAAAVRVLRYNTHRIADHAALLEKAAADEQGRVRLGPWSRRLGYQMCLRRKTSWPSVRPNRSTVGAKRS